MKNQINLSILLGIKIFAKANYKNRLKAFLRIKYLGTLMTIITNKVHKNNTSKLKNTHWTDWFHWNATLRKTK